MITVVAALIEQEGRLLVCQRRRADSFGLKWEFPGGKLKRGETPSQGLARELAEELGVRARIGAELYRTRYRYAEHAEELELIFFVAALGDAPQNLAFEQMRWSEPAALPELDFLPADGELVARLARGSLRVSAPEEISGPGAEICVEKETRRMGGASNS